MPEIYRKLKDDLKYSYCKTDINHVFNSVSVVRVRGGGYILLNICRHFKDDFIPEN